MTSASTTTTETRPAEHASTWARSALAAFADGLDRAERDRASAVTIASVLRDAVAAADRESARRKDSILDASLATLANARAESLRDLRAVARALYPDDADSASLTADELAQQATRLHELCAHEHAENVTLRARNIALESDLASRSAHVASLQRELAEVRADRSLLRKKLALAAVETSILSPITQSAPLKVGDRVRLRDAKVTDVPHRGFSGVLLRIDDETDEFGDPTTTAVFPNAIAGRVTP